MTQLLKPYLGAEGTEPEHGMGVDHQRIVSQLSCYLQLILKWNARTNLTSLRDPEKIVSRHFGESLFAGRHVGPASTLLDYGSGAGLPGIPVQILRPDIQVTLAESQGKKAAFLAEVVRELELRSEVWSGRVEDMPASRMFDVVALRAVDKMQKAVEHGWARCSRRLLILGSRSGLERNQLMNGFREPVVPTERPVPKLRDGMLSILERR